MFCSRDPSDRNVRFASSCGLCATDSSPITCNHGLVITQRESLHRVPHCESQHNYAHFRWRSIQPGAGLTRRVPTTPNVPRFSNFVVGPGNGVTTDIKGNRTGSVDFKFDSGALIKDINIPCDIETPSYHSLAAHLAVSEWLYRAADAMILTGSSIDNPSFSADVTIKLNGAGSWTYMFPAGMNLLSLSGYYQLEETLNINFTAKPKVATKFKTVSLPNGGDYFDANRGRHTPTEATVTILQDQQSSLQQIRQQLQNLKVTTQ
jgi:hypothetical protein